MNVTWRWISYLEEVEKEKEHSKMTFEFLDIELDGPSQKDLHRKRELKNKTLSSVASLQLPKLKCF